MAQEKKIHWGGGLKLPKTRWLAGWPCCCSGRRAEKIAEEGALTRDREKVTCKICLANMAKEK